MSSLRRVNETPLEFWIFGLTKIKLKFLGLTQSLGPKLMSRSHWKLETSNQTMLNMFLADSKDCFALQTSQQNERSASWLAFGKPVNIWSFNENGFKRSKNVEPSIRPVLSSAEIIFRLRWQFALYGASLHQNSSWNFPAGSCMSSRMWIPHCMRLRCSLYSV